MRETILQTHQLSIGYRAPRRPDFKVADTLNLSLQRGELVCLLGPNGVGKSTLMRTIAGMQAPLAGHVTIDHMNITDINPRALATHLSVVLTDRPNVGLLNGYALVALGRYPHTNWTGRLSAYDEAVIRWAVDAVGAADLAERPVMELSDGQRQKFMVARALAQEAKLILLDEPTAYLDLPRRAEIMQVLRQVAEQTGRAILLSTHDLDLALRTADTLWLMAEGSIHVGTPEDLVISGVFERAFQGEGVVFDRATGAFGMEKSPGQTVQVRGNGTPHIWTRRALQRAGYTLAANGTHTPMQIEVYGSEYQPVWHLYRHGECSEHHNIADLLAALSETGVSA